jgi:hypothetical protein
VKPSTSGRDALPFILALLLIGRSQAFELPADVSDKAALAVGLPLQIPGPLDVVRSDRLAEGPHRRQAAL